MALGIPYIKIASAFIDGELGWSTFEAREAQSKIRYFQRVRLMPINRWPRIVLEAMETYNFKSKSLQRMEQLEVEFGCSELLIEHLPDGAPWVSKYNSDVRKTVNMSQDKLWRKEMEKKPSLQRYREAIETRGVKGSLYDNNRGSSLLALARAGMLQTRLHLSKLDHNFDPICIKCGMVNETIDHVLFECNEIYFTQEDAKAALGFGENKDRKKLADTKKLLENWERCIGTIRWAS